MLRKPVFINTKKSIEASDRFVIYEMVVNFKFRASDPPLGSKISQH